MADIKGIELASDIYGLEDETAREDTETNASAIGNLANLETTAKTDIVSAINEVKNQAPTSENPITTVTQGVSFWAKKYGDVVMVRFDGEVEAVKISDITAIGFLPIGWRPNSPLPQTITFNNEGVPNGFCIVSSDGTVSIYAQSGLDWSAGDYISGSITLVI